MRIFRLHLLRHAMTEGNRTRCYTGRMDVPICPEGEAQLRALAQATPFPTPPLVYRSPLLRCRQSADILFPDVEQVVIGDLAEVDLGKFTGMPIAEAQATEAYRLWQEDGEHYGPPDGETGAEFRERVGRAVTQLLTDMSKRGVYEAAVVCHGGVIRTLLANYCMPRMPMSGWGVPNGCGYTLTTSLHSWMRYLLVELEELYPPGRDMSEAERRLAEEAGEEGAEKTNGEAFTL